MSYYLNLETWNRRPHFHFFKDYDQPFFNICANVDVTALYAAAQNKAVPSFALAGLYVALKAVNKIEPFRYRLRGDRVWVHDTIHGGMTLLREDGTFGFGYFDFYEDFNTFQTHALPIVEQAHRKTGKLEPRAGQDNTIHCTVIPWVSFTSFSHARPQDQADSVPKIAFGKHFKVGAIRQMPISVAVHHALMDGLHVGQFFEQFETYCADPAL